MKSIVNRQKAFTIVELLIVIVVIGILAAISIVAYNGIQNRARDTAVADSVKQVRSKIEVYNSIVGSYPLTTNFGTLTNGKLPANTAALVNSSAQEAAIPADIAAKLKIETSAVDSSDITDHSGASPIHVRACAGGAVITYFESGKAHGTYPSSTIGAGC